MSIINGNLIVCVLAILVSIEDASASVRRTCYSVLPLCSYVTPERFGAKGDGITDDTEAFLKAIHSGKKVKCKKTYRLKKSSLPVTSDGKPCYPTTSNRVKIYGGGKILFDFHINVSAALEVRDISLKSTGLEPNGLFSIMEGGQASFSNVRFDGSAVDRVNGGVSSRGYVEVKDCFFFQSDINIIALQGGFTISGTTFDANYANDSRFLSNELIHIQRCTFGTITGCTFLHSRQDIIDFYYGAKNVRFERNFASENESTLFEIKAEYRDVGARLGGNQQYNDHTEGIVIKDNTFCIKHSLAWIGTRSDERSNRTKEDGYYVRNVNISGNTVEVVGTEKVDLFFIRNVKGLQIQDNSITSASAPLFCIRVMKGETYEACDRVFVSDNHFSCPSFVGCYIEGKLAELIFSNNEVSHSSTESYLIIQKDATLVSGDVSFYANNVNNGPKLRIGTSDRPIRCRTLQLNNQSSSYAYLGSSDKLIISGIDEQNINLTGNIGTLTVEKCHHPLFITEGAEISELFISNCDLRETPSFVSSGKATTVVKYNITRTKENQLFDSRIRINDSH